MIKEEKKRRNAQYPSPIIRIMSRAASANAEDTQKAIQKQTASGASQLLSLIDRMHLIIL